MRKKTKRNATYRKERPPADAAIYGDENLMAAKLGLSVRRLQDWRVRGIGPPFVKFGAGVRYHIAATLAWAEQQTRQQTK